MLKVDEMNITRGCTPIMWGLLAGILAVGMTATSVRAQQTLFETGFETLSDFDGFYIVPRGDAESTRHELSDSDPVSGQYMHRAWIVYPNRPSTWLTNRNHRAYPTLQFHKTSRGPLATPLCVTLDVWADIDLQPDQEGGESQWLSLATFTDDHSDRWRRTVLVNVSHDGLVHLQHVPTQGQQEHIFQSQTVVFPQRQWVTLDIELDFSQDGYAKAWLDGVLVSHAFVREMSTHIAQAHFGLYAAPSLTSGEVRNDNLRIVAGHCVH
jgi:hypothetical protein